MEASLPISAEFKAAPESSRAAARPNANAPSVALPLRFTVTGLVALLLGVAWLAARPEMLAAYHYSPDAIAATHLFVLGWMVTIIMGAMYQLVPVALESRLYSERLAKWQFVLHVVGFAGMVWMFRCWNMKQVGHFGSVLGVGFLLFAYNIGRTLLRVPRWNVIATAVASALFWILFTAFAGLSIATAKSIYALDEDVAASGTMSPIIQVLRSVAPFVSRFEPLGAMHAHAHVGVIGFLVMLMAGVSYKLIPMFALSEIQNPRRALLSVVLLNLGLAGTFVAVLSQSRWKLVFGLVIVIALALYGCELLAILRARKRIVLDWGIRYFITAVCLLFPLSIIGLILSLPGLRLTPFTGQLENLYGFLALIGVVSFAIIGMLYKIVPFLVWFGVYSRHIGRARVPALAEMYSSRLQVAGYWMFLAGLLLTSVGILAQTEAGVRCGCIFLEVSLAILTWNMGLIMSHYFRPRLAPFSKPASASLPL